MFSHPRQAINNLSAPLNSMIWPLTHPLAATHFPQAAILVNSFKNLLLGKGINFYQMSILITRLLANVQVLICGSERVKLVNSSLPSRWNSHLLLSFFSCSLLVNTNTIKSLVFTRDAFYVLKWLDQIFKSIIVNLLQLCSFMVHYCLWRIFSFYSDNIFLASSKLLPLQFCALQ